MAAPTGHVEAPSTRSKSYDKGAFTVNIPENWRALEEQNSVWFAPNGG
jgi:hypothetical protein